MYSRRRPHTSSFDNKRFAQRNDDIVRFEPCASLRTTSPDSGSGHGRVSKDASRYFTMNECYTHYFTVKLTDGQTDRQAVGIAGPSWLLANISPRPRLSSNDRQPLADWTTSIHRQIVSLKTSLRLDHAPVISLSLLCIATTLFALKRAPLFILRRGNLDQFNSLSLLLSEVNSRGSRKYKYYL